MNVLFFGRLAEMIGPQLEVSLPDGSSIGQLRDQLAAEHPDAGLILRNGRARACVGDVIVHDDYVVHPTDDVEFLPPVSGG